MNVSMVDGVNGDKLKRRMRVNMCWNMRVGGALIPSFCPSTFYLNLCAEYTYGQTNA